MSFPMSIPCHSSYTRSSGPNYFEPASQASQQSYPAQISDPDIFITFQSPSCSQEAQSPIDLGGLSPASEDSLERTIKKLKLDENYTERSPKYPSFHQESSGLLPDFQPWNHSPLRSYQESSTAEWDSSYARDLGSGSSLPENIFQCPMFGRNIGRGENDGKKNMSCPFLQMQQQQQQQQQHQQQQQQDQQQQQGQQDEEDDEVIFLNSNPGTVNHNTGAKKPCLKHKVADKCGDTMKLHKGAKTIHEVKMLGEHEKVLWHSFVKVHSHIPGFPVNEIEHLDYITLILRHKAKHLFSIGKQHLKDYSQTGPDSKQAENSQSEPHLPQAVPETAKSGDANTVSKNLQTEKDQPTDPRQVFGNPYHQSLLKKCPIMSDFFQKENTQKADTPANHVNIPNPHATPMPSHISPPPHCLMARSVPNAESQPLMSCNPIMNNRNHTLQLLGSWFGMGYNHFVRSQMNPSMSGCPMQNLGINPGQAQTNAGGRERRGAFKAALSKLKGGNKK